MKSKKIKFKINKMDIVLNSRKFETSEISRGTGTIKKKKGKGSYSRKMKHKNK